MESNNAEERLRRVQLVTEPTLAHLSLHSLADELLVRVRDLLGVDTAAILLLEEDGRTLIATAAKGIEEEVERGVRIPVGGGFAGKVAATAKPVILPQVDHTVVLNPILLDKGIKSMLGVPLIANGDVVGVLHVGTLRPHTFTEEDVELLQLVADRVALAIRARRQEQQRMLAETLQRSLLPDDVPIVADIDIGVRYFPAQGAQVGGDWYDVFELPSGMLCVSVGDVVGRGLSAAIAMARLRNGIRALALVDKDPAAIVTHTNELIQHFDPGIMATMIFGFLREDGTFTYANAGHLPPLVVDDEAGARFLEEMSEPALGALRFFQYRERTLKLEPGSSLVLYTDGLVERRDESIDVGLEKLRSASEGSWESAEKLCERLAGRGVLGESNDDDLALVVIRFSTLGLSEDFDLLIKATPRGLAPLRRAIRRWLRYLGVVDQDTQDVLVAVGEAVANAIEHAYPPGVGNVVIKGAISGGALELSVRDFGQWRSSRGEHRGRGRSLMRALMDEVVYDTTPSGTTVTLRKAVRMRGSGAGA